MIELKRVDTSELEAEANFYLIVSIIISVLCLCYLFAAVALDSGRLLGVAFLHMAAALSSGIEWSRAEDRLDRIFGRHLHEPPRHRRRRKSRRPLGHDRHADPLEDL